MVIAYPWSGRDWNRVIAISGRAAMPGIPGGSGFNWRSVAGTTGMMRPRGLGRIRRRRGLGDGYDFSADIPSFTDFTSGDVPSLASSAASISNPAGLLLTNTSAGGASATSTSTPWYAGLLNSLVGVGSQITNYELNPLTNKSTYIQTPQGGIVATNSPTGATSIPGLTTTNISSFMPLLLLGGGLLVVMMMAKK